MTTTHAPPNRARATPENRIPWRARCRAAGFPADVASLVTLTKNAIRLTTAQIVVIVLATLSTVGIRVFSTVDWKDPIVCPMFGIVPGGLMVNPPLPLGWIVMPVVFDAYAGMMLKIAVYSEMDRAVIFFTRDFNEGTSLSAKKVGTADSRRPQGVTNNVLPQLRR